MCWLLSLLLILAVSLPASAQNLSSPLIPFASLPLSGNELLYLTQPTGPTGQQQSRKITEAALAANMAALSGTPVVVNCIADGATDASACINQCIASYQNCVIPQTNAGFFVAHTIINTGYLHGVSFNPYNPFPSASFPGTSFLLCSPTVSPCVLNEPPQGAVNTAQGLEKLIISRAGGKPASGTIGVQWTNGYAVFSRDLSIYNHDTCAQWGPSAGAGGIRSINYNLREGLCGTHFNIIDGWPEVTVIGGAGGVNGNGDYSTAKDFIYQTLSTVVGGGGGPNTITFDDFPFVTAAMAPNACAFRWGGWTGSGGVQGETRLTDDHFETHVPIAGVFCSDSTVPAIKNLYVTNMVSATFNGTSWGPLFALDPKTALVAAHFTDDDFDNCGAGGFTLAPTPASGPSFSGVSFEGSTFCGPPNFTSNGVGANTLSFSNNPSVGLLTIAGSWGDFEAFGNDITLLEDGAASGHIAVANAIPRTWNPVLNFSTPPTGMVVATAGNVQRTATGGFTASVDIIVSNPGSGGSGPATVTGLPYSCITPFAGTTTATMYATPMTGLTGPPEASVGSGTTPPINLYQTASTGTGTTPLTWANFVSGSTLSFTVTCPQTP